MLLQFRNISRGFVASIIFGLVGLAMVAFLIPQNGISMPGSSNLAEVGGRKITPADLTRELELELRNQRSQGNTTSRQEAIDAGFHLRVLERLISRQAALAYTQKVGVHASDSQVAETVRNIPGATNPMTGQFDQEAFRNFATQQLGYQPEALLEELRGDTAIQMTMEALTSGVRAPSSFGALALAYQAETRVVSIAEAPLSAAGNIPNPTDAQLQTFWEENQETLRVPEFRTLTLVYARPSDFVARVQVPEERLQEEFQARATAMTQPEKRTYVRIAAPTEAQANQAAQRIGRGESAQAVAQALGLQVARGENQARNEVTDANIAAAVFAAPAGAAPRVVRGSLTPWAVVQVQSITPAVAPTFASLRDELHNAIAQDEAANLLNEAISQFEDARSSGTPVAQAAQQAGLPAVTLPPVEEHGRDAQGNEVEALAGGEQMLTLAFDTAEGDATDFMPLGETDVLVSVDRVTPSFVRPLADVRDQLQQVWLGRERARRLRDMAQTVTDAVRGGQTFAAAARANGFTVQVASREIDRQMASQIPARGLAAQIFAAEQGAVTSDPRADGQAMLIAVVERINRVDPAGHPQEVEANRARIQQTLAQSFGTALQDELVRRGNVRRNERLIEQAFPRSDAQTEDAPQ